MNPTYTIIRFPPSKVQRGTAQKLLGFRLRESFILKLPMELPGARAPGVLEVQDGSGPSISIMFEWKNILKHEQPLVFFKQCFISIFFFGAG